RTSRDPRCGWRRMRWCRSFRTSRGLGDRRTQALALLVDPLLAGVGGAEGLDELDRVVADDVAHGRAVGCRALPQLDEVGQYHDERLAVGDAARRHEVAVECPGRGLVWLGQRVDAGAVLLVLLLLFERTCHEFDPLGGHG